MGAFTFLDPGNLCDGKLRVVWSAHRPADPIKGWVPSYDFDLRLDGVDDPVGRINFRAVDVPFLQMYGGHFAYGVRPEHRGQHLAERGVRLLLPLARRHGIETVWITCDPDNWPSRRTCERLGGELVEIVVLPTDCDMYHAGEREKCRYRIETRPPAKSTG